MLSDLPVPILLVDDRRENLVALSALLEGCDKLQIVLANSGDEALRLLLKHDFGLVLMDVHMPEMDGFEVARLVRANPKTRRVPIIFVTASMDSSNYEFSGYESGAFDYLIKPLEPTIVKSKVRVFCELYRQRLALEEHASSLDAKVAERTAELQRSTNELTAERERYRRLAETLELATRAAGLGIWDWNVVTNELRWDARMFVLHGVSPDKFSGAYDAWLSVVHPDDRARCDDAVRESLENASPYDIEYRICLTSGEVRDIKGDGHVLFNPQGQPLRMTGINYDITERKRVAEEVRLHRDHLLKLVDERTASLKAIVDHAADAIITIDAHGQVLSFNAAAESTFGHAATAVIGRNASMLMPPPQSIALDIYLQHCRDTGEAHIVGPGREWQGLRRDGSVFPLYLAISEYKVGGEQRFAGILRDISTQKALETSLIQAREVAEAANRAKSVFLSNMSHELRTPLNAVIGFSRLMAQAESLTPDQRRNLEIINRSGNHLLTLINDVLELSKIEAGGMARSEESVDLARLLEDVTEMLRNRAEQAGIALNLETTGLPRSVRVDAVKLRQILINLVGNAIKFTEHGGVRLVVSGKPGVTEQGGAERAVTVEFAVVDTGVGIAADACQAIFKPFVQMVTHATSAGTGLGLTLSQQYVQLLGGELHVDSKLGQGSRFSFSLSLQETEPETDAGITTVAVTGLPAADHGKRILIVEDDPDSRLLLRQLLDSLGFAVTQAVDGVEAVELSQSVQPQLIIMDWNMPRLDGLAATRHIRAQQAQTAQPQPRIVMLTASALQEQSVEALAAGADDFLRKPLEEGSLYAVLERHLDIRFIRQSTQASAEDKADAVLTAADLQELPTALKDALTMAAQEMSQAKLATVLADIARQSPQLAAGIKRMVAAFRFRELCDLLEGEVAKS